MNNSWSIQLLNANGTTNGNPQTLASLGIDSATFDLNSMSADVLTLTAGGRAFDAASLWPYGQLLALINPIGNRFFVGRVEPWTRDAIGGGAAAQSQSARIVNPWWYLEHLIYQQTYYLATIAPAQDGVFASGYTKYTTPRVILYFLFVPGQAAPAANAPPQAAGFYQVTTGKQIADAVNWAIGQGAPMQLGKTDPATIPFSSFQKGITCAEVIKHAFRFEPDFVVHWDYTTLPWPTVHFLKMQSLIPITIALP